MSDTLRITTCMYGGNSRIAFIAGVGFALAELVVASRRHHGVVDVPGFEWLPATADVDLPSVELDVIAGASAGGVAGGVLGKMLFHSTHPERDFERAARLFVDQMDVRLFAADQPCPTAVFDKRPLTLGGFRDMLDGNLPTAEQPALQADGELWLALTQLSGALEYFGRAEAGDQLVEDLNYLEGRRFDSIDYAHLRAGLAEAVEATSANPFGFSPQFICDHTALGGYAAWLQARGAHDPSVPALSIDPPPPELAAYFDGGALDNRPLGMAIDAMFRRGSGADGPERAAVILVDPDAQTAAQTYSERLDASEDGRREPHLSDQLAGLTRGYRILRHERINPDLQRLVMWQERTRLHARQTAAPRDPPSDAALATAADLLLFGGQWQRRLTQASGSCARLTGLAHALAGSAHRDESRQALLLAGLRVRRLIAMQDRWLQMRRLGRADAAARLTAIDELLTAELDAMYARAEAMPPASATALHHLIAEAQAGAPLRHDGRPVELALRRVGPPEGGLASSALGGTIGFFDVDLRAHDLLVGMALGRQAVARLLPQDAQALWRQHFHLDADPRSCADAVCWFETATGGLPWARWEASRARVAEARARTPHAAVQVAGSTQAYYPELLETTAHVLEQLWVLSALAGDRRDSTLYRLNRGVLAGLSRFLVPRLLRMDARMVRRFRDPRPVRRLKTGLLVVPLIYFLLVGTVSGLLVTGGVTSALMVGGLSLVVGALPLAAAWGLYTLKARRLRARCAAGSQLDPSGSAGPSTAAAVRPDPPRSDGRSP